MIIVFAEKSDMAIKFASALAGVSFGEKDLTFEEASENVDLKKQVRRNGVLKVDYDGKEYNFIWGEGHVAGLADMVDYNPSYSSWYSIPYPFVPKSWKYKGADSKARYINTFANLIKRDDVEYIISATDYGREGENIFFYAYQVACAKAGKKPPYMRVRINEITEEGIRKGFERLYSKEENRPQEFAAAARSRADWIMGLNLTSCATIVYREKGKKDVFNLGRVITPTLAMVVERQKEIDNYVEKVGYNICGTATDSDGNSFKIKMDHDPFDSEEAGNSFIEDLPSQLTVTDVEKKKTKNYPKGPYDTASIQADANKAYKIDLKDIDNSLQNLYDNGFITYPRTDTRFLTEDLHGEAEERIKKLFCIKSIYDAYQDIDEVKCHDKFFNNDKIDDHYGIITTHKIPVLKNLPKMEQLIYLMIATEFAKIALPPLLVRTIKVQLEDEDLKFRASGRELLDPGYTVLDNSNRTYENDIPSRLSKGDVVNVKYHLEETKTKKPEAYTEGSLITAMQKAGNQIKDKELKAAMKSVKGLGTGATRTATIKRLLEVNQIKKDKKGKLHPTEKGYFIIDNINLEELNKPDLTAHWEVVLSSLENTEYNDEDVVKVPRKFMAEIYRKTADWCNRMLATKPVTRNSEMNLEGFTCPVCGGPLSMGPYGAYCPSNDCRFSISYSAFGCRDMKDTDIKDLLEGKVTRELQFHSRKKNKDYRGKLQLDEKGQLKLIFD